METRLQKVYEELKNAKKIKNQDEFAIQLGYNSSSHINEAINGKVKISDKLINKLESKFGINPDYVRGLSEEMYRESSVSESENNYDKSISHNFSENSETSVSSHPSGREIRLKRALGGNKDEGLIYVPIAAQAGYSRNFNDPIYLKELNKLFIPGLPYKGDSYRYFDIEGDSMIPTLEEGMQVVGQKVEFEDWKHINNFYVYVIVTMNRVLVKRLYKKDEKNLVLISDNEEMYPQEIMSLEDIKELWFVKRRLDWRMTPPKSFEIIV